MAHLIGDHVVDRLMAAMVKLFSDVMTTKEQICSCNRYDSGKPSEPKYTPKCIESGMCNFQPLQ
jgi:hypothetical protein